MIKLHPLRQAKKTHIGNIASRASFIKSYIDRLATGIVNVHGIQFIKVDLDSMQPTCWYTDAAIDAVAHIVLHNGTQSIEP